MLKRTPLQVANRNVEDRYRLLVEGITDYAIYMLDAEGFVWSALYGGSRVVRIAPDGRVDRTIELPVEQPTSCQFAGPNLDVLFVTTARQRLTQEQLAQQPLAGALLAADVGVRGLPETRYRG